MLQLHNITHRYGSLAVLQGIDLEVREGEILCLLGPSGCGKTTLLRIIAGLERPSGGDVRLGGRSIIDVPVHRRDFGLMFQDFALFPHMNVADNVAFGLRMRQIPAAERQERVAEALSLVGLSEYARRDVSQLSGGERQRVALARSLAPRPRLLMLDEPMGSLDAALRDRLVVELREIVKSIGLTAIYVTHDQQEAYAVADRIGVMNAGRIEQLDTPQALYCCPRTVFVARFLGLTNIIPVDQAADGHVTTPLGTFALSAPADAVLLHPDSLSLGAQDGALSVEGRVIECTFQGAHYRLQVRHESGIELTLPHSVRAGFTPGVGQRVWVQINPDGLIPLRAGLSG